MAKRNKKGGWTGTAAGSSAVKSGGGPQVERQLSESRKYDPKYSAGMKIIRAILFILVCVLLGSLIFQATSKNMGEYWGVAEQKDGISAVEITLYSQNGDEVTKTLTSSSEIEAFCTALDESKLKRLWSSDDESVSYTAEICIYMKESGNPEFQALFVDDHVYLLYMPTYPWYLTEGSALLEYLK